MGLLCWLFGHSPPVYAKKGWYSPGEEYGYIMPGPRDGIGRWHGEVWARCARCDEEFKASRIHIIEDPKMAAAMNEKDEALTAAVDMAIKDCLELARLKKALDTARTGLLEIMEYGYGRKGNGQACADMAGSCLARLSTSKEKSHGPKG